MKGCGGLGLGHGMHLQMPRCRAQLFRAGKYRSHDALVVVGKDTCTAKMHIQSISIPNKERDIRR